MSKKRQQLTLFLPEKEAVLIEKIRRKYNPIQYSLIASHVTLCREDEIIRIETVLDNIRTQNLQKITIALEGFARISDNKGLMITAKKENKEFHSLRAQILKGLFSKPRKHLPHVTLMHPRNSTCTDVIFENIQKELSILPKITFSTIALIEQEIGKKWRIIQEFPLIEDK